MYYVPISLISIFFFFNDTATTEIYTLSLHDALPICPGGRPVRSLQRRRRNAAPVRPEERNRRTALHYPGGEGRLHRSEEHTSEIQSQSNLVCRLLLEKKKKK